MDKRRTRPLTWPIAGSIALHVLLVGGAGIAAYRSLADKEAREGERRSAAGPRGVIAIELPGVAEGSLVEDKATVPEGEKPEKLGGAAEAHLDNGVAGSGGDNRGERATNLAAQDDAMRRDTDIESHLDRDQIQRMKTAARRTTREDRRSTTEPMELTFLASGKGALAERRPNAETDPSRGALHADAPGVVGGHVGTGEAEDSQETGSSVGASRAGALIGSPGEGIRNARAGTDHRASASITHARPSVAEAKPSIPSPWNGRPNDTIDSDQEVSNAVRGIVQASVAGGRGADGRGGQPAVASDPGAGGGTTARGSVARAMGNGDGELVDWNTNDPTLIPYLRHIHAKVDPLWANAFPKSAMMELKQGTVILDLTVSADGRATVHWPPVRPSGIDEFDRNCADAIRRASPFNAIPQVLKDRGYAQLRIRAPFVAKNPVIQ